jgi:hypothetical protein
MKFIFYLTIIILLFAACDKKANDIVAYNISISEGQKIPIIMIDPNINAWSMTPTLYGSHLQHPDGEELPLVGIIRVDGKSYRFMGSSELPDKDLAGMSSDADWYGKYTFIKPDDGWEHINYNDKGWDLGQAPFGRMQSLKVNTIWPSPAIWLRREINIAPSDIEGKKLYLKYSHDDELQLFVNGIELVKTGFEWKYDEKMEIPNYIIETFKDGKIVIAAFCKNIEGEAFLDFGIYFQKESNIDKWRGKYTFSQPSEDWLQYDYNDEAWNIGDTPFGSSIDYRVNTEWNTKDIWVRKEFKLNSEELEKTLLLNYSYDDNLTLFVNGIQILKTPYEWKTGEIIEIPEDIKTTTIDGTFIVAAHCENKSGGAFLNFNLITDNIAKQKFVKMTATQTSYTFQCGQIDLNLRFTSPLLLDNIEIMSRPINYISYEIESLDGKEHEVDLYFETTPAWASNGTFHTSTSKMYEKDNLVFLKTGLTEQKIFDFEDNAKEINWGYFYMCAEKVNSKAYLGEASLMRSQFMKNRTVSKDTINTSGACMGIIQSLGKQKESSGKIMIGYDDIYSIQYFGENLRPYWNKNGNRILEELFVSANQDFKKIIKECSTFDEMLLNKITDELGCVYATFFAENFRPSITRNKLVGGKDSDYILFCIDGTWGLKNNSLLFQRYNINLLKAQLEPIFHYYESGKWSKIYPPSNLGQYPLANGQISESYDPVETTSNILVICAVITALEGNTDYIQTHWLTLTKWNDYLVDFIISNQVINAPKEKNELSNIYTIATMGISSFTEMTKKMNSTLTQLGNQFNAIIL